MAQSYDRRINLYINIDGKQVQNNVKSIRAEMLKIVNAQKLMTIGSQEYNLATQKIRQLNGVLAQHSEQVREVQRGWSMKGMAEGFNRYMGMITAFAASATGLVIGFKQIIQTFNDYEERISNLSAITGLAGDDLEWLSNKAKELSTSTLDGGIRITQSAQDIVDAFTKMGSARPELLKNKEALVAVTTEALILAAASKMQMEPAIMAVAAAMNQFNLDASEARRIINVFGAGALEGNAEVENLTASLKNVGTVAADSNMSLEETVAALEVLGKKQLFGEEGGTKLRGALLKMRDAGVGYTSGQFNLRDALAEVNTKINEQAGALEKDAIKQKVFGIENITAGTALLANVGLYDRLTKAVTGTNVAVEQAIINTDNNNAKLAQAKNRLNVMSIELGEKLAPALQVSTNGLSYLIKGLTVSIDFFVRHKAMIVTVTSAIIAYTAWLKIEAIWEARKNKEKLISIALGKLQALAYTAQFAGISLYNAALALLKGNLAAASVQFRAFSAALMANPIGLIIGAVTALGVALYMYSGQMTAAQKAQQTLNDVNLEAQKNIVEEKLKIETLLDLARDEKLSKLDRFKAITQLNQISPKYLGNLTLENINTKVATESVKAYTDSLLENARAQAAKEKLAEIDKKILEAKSGEIGFWDKARAGGLMYAAGLNFIGSTEAKNAKASSKVQEDLIAQREKLIGVIKDQAVAELLNPGGGKTDPVAQDLIKLKEKELADAQAIIATTPAEVAARNKKVEAIQKEIKALNELGTTKAGKSNAEKLKEDAEVHLKLLDDAHNDIMAKLVVQYEQEAWTDARFKVQQVIAEQAYLEEKKKLLEKYGQSTVQVDAQISQSRIDVQKDFNAAIADLDKEILDQKEEDQKNEDAIIQSQIDATNLALDNTKDITDKEKERLQERAKNYQMISETIVGSLSDMLSGSLDEYASYGDALILMALQVLKQLAPIWAAQIVGGSLATPDSIMTGGIAGIAKFTAMLAIMEGFIGIAEGAVKKGIEKKRNAGTQKHAAGGFTHGEKTYIAGEAGKKWISPNWMVDNPITGPIIANLEAMRTNPVTVTQAAVQASKSNRSSTGINSVGSTSNTDKPEFIIPGASSDPALTDAINLNTKAIALLMKRGVSFPMVAGLKKMKEVEDLLNQTGMGGFNK